MTTVGSNFISGITTTIFNSNDVVNKQYVDSFTQGGLPSQTGNAGKFLTTTDGTELSWGNESNYQEFTVVGTSTYAVPSYANLIFIEAVGSGAGGSAGQTSAAAGLTWILRTVGASTGLTNGFAFGNNINVASTSNGVHTSTDTITWILRTSTFTSLSAAIFVSPNYIVGGDSGRLLTSTDSIVWIIRTCGFGALGVRSFTFGTAPENTHVAGGDSGRMSSSTDAINWIVRTCAFATNTVSALTFGTAPVNTYVAGGSDGRLCTSTDAISWELRTSGFGANQINALTFGNNTYVAASNAGVLNTSTDAINWTLRTSGFGLQNIRALAFGNNTYIVAGGSGILNTSTNAINWTLRTAGQTSAINCVNISNLFYLSGASGTSTITVSPFFSSGRGGSSGSYTAWYVPNAIVSTSLTINIGAGGTGGTFDGDFGFAGNPTQISWTGPTTSYTLTANGGLSAGISSIQSPLQSSFYMAIPGLNGAESVGGAVTFQNGINGNNSTLQYQPASGGSGAIGAGFTGGSGGNITVFGISTTGGLGGTPVSINGQSPFDTSFSLVYGAGGGGGGNGTATAGNGGNGSSPGGGGGGGGLNGTVFGNGGNGGNGYVKISWW